MRVDRGLFIVMSIGLLACVFCIFFIVPYAGVVWDEALAVSWVSVAFDALKHGNMGAFQYAVFGQIIYPPLFSLFYAMPLTVFQEFSIQNARTAGVFWFFASGVLLYFLSGIVAKKYGRSVGIISCLLLFTAPITLVHAGIAMREMVAVFWSLATMIWYIRSQKSLLRGILAAFGLIILFGIKYHYELFLLIPFGIEAAVEFFSGRQKVRTVIYHSFLVFMLAVAAVVWLYYPWNKSTIVIDILMNKGNYTGGFPMLTYILFVPNILLYTYSFSPVIGICLILALVWSVWHLRYRPIRILWVTFAVNIVLAFLHTVNIQERYFMLTIPFLYILTAIMITDVYVFIRNRWHNGMLRAAVSIAGFAATVIMGFDVYYFLPHLYAVGSLSLKTPAFNQLDYNDTWFNFDRRTWPKRMPWESHERPQDVLDFIMDNLDIAKSPAVLGRPGELSPDLINITQILRIRTYQYPILPFKSMVATIEVLPGSRYFTRDFRMLNAWRISEIRAVESDPSWSVYKKRDFKELGMVVTIFSK